MPLLENSRITDLLKELAALSGQAPSRIDLQSKRGGRHILSIRYVGNRNCLDDIARMAKHFLDAGLGEDLSPHDIRGLEKISQKIHGCTPGRDVTHGNIQVTAKNDSLYILSADCKQPEAEIADRLQKAVETAKHKKAVQQVKAYLAARTDTRFPTLKSKIHSDDTVPTQTVFTIALHDMSPGFSASRFGEHVMQFKERAERMFGETTPVQAKIEGDKATISITGNPTLLLEAIRQKDPQGMPAPCGRRR